MGLSQSMNREGGVKLIGTKPKTVQFWRVPYVWTYDWQRSSGSEACIERIDMKNFQMILWSTLDCFLLKGRLELGGQAHQPASSRRSHYFWQGGPLKKSKKWKKTFGKVLKMHSFHHAEHWTGTFSQPSLFTVKHVIRCIFFGKCNLNDSLGPKWLFKASYSYGFWVKVICASHLSFCLIKVTKQHNRFMNHLK